MSARHPPPLNPLGAVLWLVALAFLLGFGGYLATSLPLPWPPLGVAELGLGPFARPGEIPGGPARRAEENTL